MTLEFDEQVRSLVERNYDDERRHLATLLRPQQREVGMEGAPRPKRTKRRQTASRT